MVSQKCFWYSDWQWGNRYNQNPFCFSTKLCFMKINNLNKCLKIHFWNCLLLFFRPSFYFLLDILFIRLFAFWLIPLNHSIPRGELFLVLVIFFSITNIQQIPEKAKVQMLHSHMQIHAEYNNAIIKTSEDFFKKIYLSLYLKGCVWEGVGDRTELQ